MLVDEKEDGAKYIYPEGALDQRPQSERPLNALNECSENIALTVELRMPHRQTRLAIEPLEALFHSLFIPFKTDQNRASNRTVQSGSLTLRSKGRRLEGRDWQARAYESRKLLSSIVTHQNASSRSNKSSFWCMALIIPEQVKTCE